jgi:long-chain fatty acid transport protein
MCEDASAVTVNPANLTELTQPELAVSLALGYARREFTDQSGAKEETRDPWGVLPNVFLAWPLANKDYVAGLGITTPYGRFTKWDRDVSFRFTSPRSSELRLVNVNPTLGIRVSDTLRAGIGANVYWSELTFDQDLPWAALTGDPADGVGPAGFEGDGVGFGVNGALTWKPDARNTLALVVRSPFRIEYEGTFLAGGMPPAAHALGLTPTSDFEAEIEFPTVVSFGYGFQASETVRVEFDVEWLEHSRNRAIPVDIGANSVLLEGPAVPQDWDDNWTFGVGADWAFRPNWVERAGFIHLQTPTPTHTTIPVASEEDQEVVSIGLGYDNGIHAIDLAYAVGLFGGREVRDQPNPEVNGTYDFESHLVAVMYRRRL